MSVASSFLCAPVDRALGRRGAMVAAAAVYLLGKVWFVLDPYSMPAIYVNAVSVGVGMTFAFVFFSTNRNNICDLIE